MKLKARSNRFWIWAILLLTLASLILLGCWVKNITTPYYTQTTNYYCGAASAQMILNSQKLGIYVPSQATLYNYIHPRNQCSGWATDPKGLSDVLNNYAGSKAHFVVSALSNQDDGIKKLAYTIDKYGVPPASLIYGCMHWVVVRGVITDVQPTTAASYTINGFFVNDPWYGSNTLGENKYIDSAHWKSDYFTGCGWCGSPGGNKFISVVDPEPIPKVAIKFPTVLARRAQMLSPREAQERATAAMKQFESQREFQKQFAEAYGVMKNSKIGIPLFVLRGDKQREGYYIIPLLRGDLTSGAILIDAYSGQFQEVTHVKTPIEYSRRFETKNATELFRKNLPNLKVRPELMKQLSVKTTSPLSSKVGVVDGSKTFRELNIRSEDIKITKMDLVWEPSSEAQNPYYPLWRTSGTVKRGAEQTLGFMDFKGRVLPDVTRAVHVEMRGGGIN
jgi:hypothetical protein